MSDTICLRTTEAADTKRMAAALAGVLVSGDIVVLSGQLGAGKTTFAQGVAAGLGVRDAVTSPTFTLLRPYACTSPPAAMGTLWHADLYRLERVRDVEELGIDELVEDDAVALVEWGDVVGSLFGDRRLEVHLSRPDDEADSERDVTVQPSALMMPGRRRQLDEALSPWVAHPTSQRRSS